MTLQKTNRGNPPDHDLAEQIVTQQSDLLTKAGLEHSAHQLVLLEEYVRGVLHEGQDYGIIPGTTGKPTLLKPGAANVIAAFNCYPDAHIETETFDLSQGLIFYRVRVDVLRQDNGLRRATGQGSCSSYEKKYRYRNAMPECPNCHKENVRVSKGGGFYCWQKTGGCGASFHHDDVAITSQPIGQVVNEDPMEQANTILKMAVKRAEVDAALRLPGVARFFTQDLEDMQPQPDSSEPAPTPKPIVAARPPVVAKAKPSVTFCGIHDIRMGKHPTEGICHKLSDGTWCHGEPPADAISTAEGSTSTSTFPDTPLGALQQEVYQARDIALVANDWWLDFEQDVLKMEWSKWVKLGGTVDTARARWNRLTLP